VFSPDKGCGELGSEITIVFEVKNQGDVRVGPGVEVSIYGTWDGEEEALQGKSGPLSLELESSIEPGRSVIRSVAFEASDQTDREGLPDSVRVVVDSAEDTAFGAERECNEDNNDLSQKVEPGEPRPDLSLELGEASVECAEREATVAVTVKNEGTADAEPVVVQIFAGNPAAGGTLVAEVTLDKPLGAGKETTLDVQVPEFPVNRKITLWGWVDPNGVIDECNESDNTDPADNPVECRVVGHVR
jgi:subtilase family serine protease